MRGCLESCSVRAHVVDMIRDCVEDSDIVPVRLLADMHGFIKLNALARDVSRHKSAPCSARFRLLKCEFSVLETVKLFRAVELRLEDCYTVFAVPLPRYSNVINRREITKRARKRPCRYRKLNQSIHVRQVVGICPSNRFRWIRNKHKNTLLPAAFVLQKRFCITEQKPFCVRRMFVQPTETIRVISSRSFASAHNVGIVVDGLYRPSVERPNSKVREDIEKILPYNTGVQL